MSSIDHALHAWMQTASSDALRLENAADALAVLAASTDSRASHAVSRTIAAASEVVRATAHVSNVMKARLATLHRHDSKRIADATEEFETNRKHLRALAGAIRAYPHAHHPSLEIVYDDAPVIPASLIGAVVPDLDLKTALHALFRLYSHVPDPQRTWVHDWLTVDAAEVHLGVLKSQDCAKIVIADCEYLTPDDISVRCVSGPLAVSDEHFSISVKQSDDGAFRVAIAYKGSKLSPLPLTVLRDLQFTVHALNVQVCALPFASDTMQGRIVYMDRKHPESTELLCDVLFDDGANSIECFVGARKFGHFIEVKTKTMELSTRLNVTFPLLHVQFISDWWWIETLSELHNVPLKHRNIWLLIVTQRPGCQWFARAYHPVLLTGQELRTIMFGEAFAPLAFQTRNSAIVVAYATKAGDVHVHENDVRLREEDIRDDEVVHVQGLPKIAQRSYAGPIITTAHFDAETLFISYAEPDVLWAFNLDTRLAAVPVRLQSDLDTFTLRRAVHVLPELQHVLAVHAVQAETGANEIRLYKAGVCVGICVVNKQCSSAALLRARSSSAVIVAGLYLDHFALTILASPAQLTDL